MNGRRYTADDWQDWADEMERTLMRAHRRMDALGIPHGAWWVWLRTEGLVAA